MSGSEYAILDADFADVPPDWLDERIRRGRVERTPVAVRDDFEADSPRVLEAVYRQMQQWIADGWIPVRGDRDHHIIAFMLKLHGLGVTADRAVELYDYYLHASGGEAPDNWPGDAKTLDKIRRVWEERITGQTKLGEELPPTLGEVFAAFDDGRRNFPKDRLWTIDDMLDVPELDFWDADKMLPRVEGGYLSIWFGKWGHHKTNLLLAKLFEVVQTNQQAKVLYMMGEGRRTLRSRLLPMMTAFNLDRDAIRDRMLFHEVPLMANPAAVTASLQAIAAAFKPDICVIDTMSTALAGEDEDTRTASMFTETGAIGAFCAALGALTILVGHEGDGKPGKIRGSIGFYVNTSQVVYVKANADEDAVACFASTRAPHGRFKDGASRLWHYAIEEVAGAPIVPRRISEELYGLLTGDVRFEPVGVGGLLAAAAITSAEAAWPTRLVVGALYPQQPGMDAEQWATCVGALCRGIEKAARKTPASWGHLFTEEAGELRWWVRQYAAST